MMVQIKCADKVIISGMAPFLVTLHLRGNFLAIVWYSLNSCFHTNLIGAQTFQSEAEVSVVGSQRGAELGTAGEHAIRFGHTSTHQVIDQHPDVALGPGQGHWRQGERPAAGVHPSPQTLQKQGTFGSVEGLKNYFARAAKKSQS